MNPQDKAWQQLVAAARQTRDDRDTAAPFGFSTRVAALAMEGPMRPMVSLVERFSWRALGLACLLALVSVTASYTTGTGNTATDDVLSDDSTVGTLFASF